MREIKLKAYGKINLGLDVIRKREDSYHDLDMIMQTVGVYDDVIINVEDDVNETEICVTTDTDILPNDKGNLAFMAAKLLMDEYNVTAKVKIHLVKRIPIAGGMAGGSADCAATLKGIDEIFDLNLSLEKLQEYGVKLGADVPYCLLGGTARAQGIGEILTKLPTPPKCHVIIAKPNIFVSTAFVYGHIKPSEIERHPDIEGMIKDINNQNLNGLAKKLANVMEDVTIPFHPEISQIKKIMLDEGALNAMMSGSGPTVFGLFDQEDKANAAMDKLQKESYISKLYMTEFV